MAKRKEDEVKPGAPAWQSTFADLMNLLLCFFVLLFSMSTVDAQKFEMIAASFNQTFSIFTAGATAIGDGVLVSNGVSQLNELDKFINSTGKMDDGDVVSEDVAEAVEELKEAIEELEQAQMEESEQMAEAIQEAIDERDLGKEIDVEFTSQYVQLTLKGSLLFDSGSTELKADVLPVLDQVGVILQRYPGSIIEIEGHTDNVPIHNGRFEDNNVLSMYRALSVADYIRASTKLNPAYIKSSGRGDYVPIADNGTPEGRAQNRRVEIKVYNTYNSDNLD